MVVEICVMGIGMISEAGLETGIENAMMNALEI